MTDQEMFNRAWNGLKSQGFERCVVPGSHVCRLLNDAGMRCAASWVMAGEAWDDASPGLGGTSGLGRVQRMGRVHVFRGFQDPLGRHLQRAHDMAPNAAGVERNLRELAANAGLKIPNE